MPVEKYSISLHPSVAAEVQRRQQPGDEGHDRSTILNRALDRYFAILADSQRQLAEQFSDGEIGLMLDILNGTLFAEPFSIRILDREVLDSLPDGYAEKWEIDGPVLVEKVRGLSYADQVALVDAVERWWNRIAAGEQPKPGEALRPKRSAKPAMEK